MAVFAHATDPSSRELSSNWQFRFVTGPADAKSQPQIRDWHAAKVPGMVQTDLLDNKLIPEPFYQDNETRLQWIGESDWEYQTTFSLETAALAHEHLDLVFDGLDTFAEVTLNDHAILTANNMFRRWRVDAKPHLHAGTNTLHILFHSPITKMLPYVKSLPYVLPAISTQNGGNEEDIATAPYTRKAPYNYGWDWGPRFVTEGIWRPARLEMWDALRIESFHLHQQSVSKDLARLTAEVDVEADKSTTATVSFEHFQGTELQGKASPDGTVTVALDAGTNHISFPIRITNPNLWYPVGYGPQNRYTFNASVKAGKNAEASIAVKTGLRSVELRREADSIGQSFYFVINGIPVFAKGADMIPYDSFPTRVTAERHREILQAARDAHMNMVREWGGGLYEPDDFYDIADELGILVWQEFMFGGDMVPGDAAFQENVRQEAIDQVKRLRDHPSIVLWCGNNEVETGWLHWGDRQGFRDSQPYGVSQKVWQDYMVLFADILKIVVHDYTDPTPYTPSSPSAGFTYPPDSDKYGDMHFWSVWHALAPPTDYLRVTPRFMSEFGFQSFPEMRTIRSFAKPEDLDIRSTVMQSHQKNHGGNERILTYMLREYREPKDFASFVYLSQVQQAEVIKLGAEHLRRSRPRTMGSLYWQLNDCWPVASWASIDYYGRWKALQYYARRFYDDVLVSPYRHDGKVEVYIVNDKLEPVTGKIRVRLMDFSGNVLSGKMQDVQIPAASSAVYLTIDENDLFADAAKTNRNRNFMIVNFEVAGKEVSHNEVFFDITHNLDLPVSPKIEADITEKTGGFTVTLKSASLARSVSLSFGDTNTKLSDNYFDLLPNEPVTLHLTSPASLDQLKAEMKVMSLTDAYASHGTRY
ncbi:MAG TPA: glycoside hydrolase family 2 protein [Candidatus Solibacter sp.]|nr:glycoside hydrolase family 2 protein [Candidatus Solibacter sp.]